MTKSCLLLMGGIIYKLYSHQLIVPWTLASLYLFRFFLQLTGENPGHAPRKVNKAKNTRTLTKMNPRNHRQSRRSILFLFLFSIDIVSMGHSLFGHLTCHWLGGRIGGKNTNQLNKFCEKTVDRKTNSKINRKCACPICS